MITAITGTGFGLNVFAEMICGFVLPGLPGKFYQNLCRCFVDPTHTLYIVANMYFKTLGYNTLNQAGAMAIDLKVGHYLKIPPRVVFLNQMLGTLIGCIFNYIVNHVCWYESCWRPPCSTFCHLERGQFSTRSTAESDRQQHLEWINTAGKFLLCYICICYYTAEQRTRTSLVDHQLCCHHMGAPGAIENVWPRNRLLDRVVGISSKWRSILDWCIRRGRY